MLRGSKGIHNGKVDRRSEQDLKSRDSVGEGAPTGRSRSRGFGRRYGRKLHGACDFLTGFLLCGMVVFSPWAFGTTQEWSIGTMNVGGYVLGGLLCTKWLLRWIWGFRPAVWGQEDWGAGGGAVRWITRLLALLTGLVLLYCFVSAANARATFFEEQNQFAYRECILWLPHSYDSILSWQAFWNYLALSCVFWSVRDWLLTKTREECREEENRVGEKRGDAAHSKGSATFVASGDVERRADDRRIHEEGPADTEKRGDAAQSKGSATFIASGDVVTPGEVRERGYLLPRRLKLLLWVLSLNGALLAAEGLLQHVLGDGRLLWLVTPRINKAPDSQFGPYAYRSNAAQYFLLAWPLTLGLWWVLRGRGRWVQERLRTYNNLLPCVFLMALVPLISLSRAAAIIGFVCLAIAVGLIGTAEYRSRRGKVPWMVLLLGLVLLVAGLMDWQHLNKRFQQGTLDSGRHLIWENSLKIVREYPLFGTGPGTFDSVYQFYRPAVDDPWYATAHNDWLEVLLTFGAVGTVPLLTVLILLLVRSFFLGGIAVHRVFMQLILLALASCLVYAVVDFPFQVYSVLFLFVLECAVLSCVYRAAARKS